MSGTVLVLGASGLFGSRVAQAFALSGWKVRKYQRDSDLVAAAKRADVLVNGLNPPMYHNWAQVIPQITAQVIAAAGASGATVIVPGNVYPFGVQPGPWGAETRHQPCSRKGKVRADMEASYKASGQRVIILRGGDFMDELGKTTMINSRVLKNTANGKLELFGPPDVQRAYAYLPDMARATVKLAEMRDQLPRFTDVPFGGLTFSMNDLRDELQRQTARNFKFTRFPWWFLRLAAPFWELARELPEMRYLFDTPHRLDPAPIAALMPDFQMTSFADVIAAHVAALGITAA